MSPAATRSLTFTKYSGAGNDFLIVDERRESSLGEMAALARALCRRGTSVGADGLLVISLGDIEPVSAADGRMRLWNADGSAAEFSGNAARCAVRYLVDEGIAPADRVRLQTDIGVVTGTVAGNTCGVQIPGHARVYPQRRLRVEGRDLVGTYVTVGVPFFVLLHEDPEDLPVRFLGRAIRNHPELQPAGANVDFVRVQDEQSLFFRVYERGVENETLSSGTGSISAALAASAAGRVESPVACNARGGTLTVRFRRLTEVEVAQIDSAEPEPARPTEALAALADSEIAPAEGAGAAAEPDSGSGSAARISPASERILSGDSIVFGDLQLEGETRRVMEATASADAFRMR